MLLFRSKRSMGRRNSIQYFVLNLTPNGLGSLHLETPDTCHLTRAVSFFDLLSWSREKTNKSELLKGRILGNYFRKILDIFD